jgi:hypothetical protein
MTIQTPSFPPTPVIPAKAGIQATNDAVIEQWIPAFAGMTGVGARGTISKVVETTKCSFHFPGRLPSYRFPLTVTYPNPPSP